MKPSHIQTPRMARDGYWQTGYQSAAPLRDPLTEFGWWLLSRACLVGLVCLFAASIMGWL